MRNTNKIYGIEYDPISIINQNKKEAILKLFHGKDILVLGVRTNVCTWQKSFGTSYYTMHYVTLVDVNKKGILCNDSMPIKEAAFLSWEQVEEGVEIIIRVSKSDKKEKVVTPKHVCKLVKNKFRVRDIRRLQKRILKDFDLQREFAYEKNIWNVPLYNLFIKMTGVHIQFSEYLDKCMNQEQLSERARKIAIRWEEMKLMIVKIHLQYCKHQYINKKQIIEWQGWFEERFEKLISEESSFLREIEGNLHKEPIKEKKQFVKTCYKKRLIYNEKSHFLNEEFDVVNRQELLSKLGMNIEKKEFYQSTFCNEQKIEINQKISGIILVGYATYGTQFETLEIQSTNKSFGVSMVFSDWTEEPLLEEKVIWKGEFIAKEEGKFNYIGKLVEKEIPIGEIYCKQIILPKNSYIHLFKLQVF